LSYTVVRGDTLSSIARKLGVSLSALEQANPMGNFNKIGVGQQLNVPGGGAPAPSGPSGSQVQQAIDQYGPMYQIVEAVPELKQIAQDAITQQYSQNQLTAKVMGSQWYQTHANSVRNLIMTQASDPAEYQQQIDNAVKLVTQTADSMGRNVDANSLAWQYLANGWTTQTLQDAIGGTGNATAEPGASGADWGTAGQVQAHLTQVAQEYGVPYTDDFVQQWVNRIQSGTDTTDGFDQVMKARAKAAYPQFAAQIDAGQTMTQIADPYMAQMAKTLEVPQSQVTLNDPYIKQALSSVDPKTGAMTNQPLWKFEQTLKADPRYGQTDQAKADAYTMLNKIGTDWGFTTGGSASGLGASNA
jgi:LysM repeat protein